MAKLRTEGFRRKPPSRLFRLYTFGGGQKCPPLFLCLPKFPADFKRFATILRQARTGVIFRNVAMMRDLEAIFGKEPTLRDVAWQERVRRELAREFAAREGRSLPANGFAWLVCAAFAFAIGLHAILIAALTLRVAAMSATHWACRQVAKAVDKGEDFEPELNTAGAILASSGFSWGMLTWAATGSAELNAAMIGLLAVVTTGVCLICSVAGLVPRTMGSFTFFFVASVMFGALVVNGGDRPEIAAVVLLPLIGSLSWGVAVRRQAISAASDAVDNYYLREELAEALANAEFLSRHDALTGLTNRRALFDDPRDEPAAGRTRFLLLLDLDKFKSVNDRYGHAVGDDVLVAVSDTLRRFGRRHAETNAHAYRLGGEEFALVVDAHSEQQIVNFAEGLRVAIREDSPVRSARDLHVTASFGVCEWPEGVALRTVMNCTDRALYEAKKKGRDRVERSTGSREAA